jgi:hypothetical protein
VTPDEIAMRILLVTNGKDPFDSQSMSDTEFLRAHVALEELVRGSSYTIDELKPHIRAARQTYDMIL